MPSGGGVREAAIGLLAKGLTAGPAHGIINSGGKRRSCIAMTPRPQLSTLSAGAAVPEPAVRSQAACAHIARRLVLLGLLLTLLSTGLPIFSSRAATPVRYETTRSGVAYLGSKACRGCHQPIYDAYFNSAMGRSTGSADDQAQLQLVSSAVAVDHARFDRRYEVYRRGDELFQTEYGLDPSGDEIFRTTHKLEYAMGSGTHGISYLVRRGRHLFQAPLSYYTTTGSWELSPGYETEDLGFTRQIETSCIACHIGRPNPVEGKPGFYEDPAFEEPAIGCENCHGPGQAHVAARLESLEVSAAVDPTIFDPSKAPARLGENVCRQCHQWGDARTLLPGKTHFDFRPGTYLINTMAILKVPVERSAGTSVLLEHHFGMETSRCFRASEGRLSCFSCYEVHNPPEPAAKVSYYRDKCRNCHTNEACAVSLAKRQARTPSNDCSGCHMPASDLQRIRHTALTNHRIPRRPAAPPPDDVFDRETPGLDGLLLLNPPAEDETVDLPAVTRFRAFAEIAIKKPAYKTKPFEMLAELAAGNPEDPMVLAGLGHQAKQEKTPEGDRRAIAYLTKAVEANTYIDSVYNDLAEILNRSGRGDEALTIVDQGLERTPFSRRLSRMRVFTLIQLKRFPDAEETVRKHVETHPNDAETRDLLGKIDAANAGQ